MQHGRETEQHEQNEKTNKTRHENGRTTTRASNATTTHNDKARGQTNETTKSRKPLKAT